MTLSVPEKKAILAIVDLTALACSIAAAFAFVANIPSLAIAKRLQRNPPRTAQTVLGGFLFFKT